MSSTATTVPRPPVRPTFATFPHAAAAFTDAGPKKFHCVSFQPPGCPEGPGSFGHGAGGVACVMRAIGLRATDSTPGSARTRDIAWSSVSPAFVRSIAAGPPWRLTTSSPGRNTPSADAACGNVAASAATNRRAGRIRRRIKASSAGGGRP